MNYEQIPMFATTFKNTIPKGDWCYSEKRVCPFWKANYVGFNVCAFCTLLDVSSADGAVDGRGEVVDMNDGVKICGINK